MESVTHHMKTRYMLHGFDPLEKIGTRYCSDGCEHWLFNGKTFYQELGADPGVIAWSPPAGTQPHPVPEPTPRPQPAADDHGETQPAVTVRVDNIVSPKPTWSGQPRGPTLISLSALVVSTSPIGGNPKAYKIAGSGSSHMTELVPLQSHGTENGRQLYSGTFPYPPDGQQFELEVSLTERSPGHNVVVSTQIPVLIQVLRPTTPWKLMTLTRIVVIAIVAALYWQMRKRRSGLRSRASAA